MAGDKRHLVQPYNIDNSHILGVMSGLYQFATLHLEGAKKKKLERQREI